MGRGWWLWLGALAVGCAPAAEGPPADVAVTSTYLECAARDLVGDSAAVLCLVGPGMCPGHFDVRPSQVQALRGCRLLVRFDFQASLDAKLADVGVAVVPVALEGGLGEPETYAAACRQVGEGLEKAGLAEKGSLAARTEAIAARMRKAGEAARAEIRRARLAGRPVLASAHQSALARALGLNVVATFAGADAATTKNLSRAIEAAEAAGADLILANRPEGTRVAEALAGRLGGRVVVFDNFPAEAAPDGFDRMLRRNVEALLEVAGR